MAFLRMLGLTLLMLAPELAQAKIVTLNFWEQDPPNVAEELDKWITVFQMKNPDIRVIRQHYDNEELRTKYLRSSMTGDGADLVYGPNDIAGVFHAASVIQPVEAVIDPSIYSPASRAMVTLDQKLMGVPLSEGSHILFYGNRKLVPKLPETMTELIATAQKIQGANHGLSFFQSEPFWFAAFVQGFGGQLLSRGPEGVKVQIQTPEMLKALQYLVDLKDKAKILPKDCDYDCAKTSFMSGRSAFHFNGDWELAGFQQHYKDDLLVAPLPRIEAGGRHLSPMLGGRFIYLNAALKGEKLEAAKKFLAFIGSPVVQQRVATRLRLIPARLDVRASEAILKDPILSATLAAAEFATPMPPDVELRAAWDGLRIMVQRAMSGTETPEQAIITGQKAAEEALRSIKKEGF